MRRTWICCLLSLVLALPATAVNAAHAEAAAPAALPDGAVSIAARLVEQRPAEKPQPDAARRQAAQSLEDSNVSLADSYSDLNVVSLGGADRIETAINVSRHAFPHGSDAVIITNGYSWPDALSGSSLAGMIDSPVLLTAPGTLPSAVSAEITRLGASIAFILGGTSAVSPGVENSLSARMGADNVVRIAGDNRYETSAIIAILVAAVQEEVFGYHDGVAFVATGANFPDALGASPLSAATWWPILLVNPAGVDEVAAVTLQWVASAESIMLGGAGALSLEVQNSITKVLGRMPRRISGTTRYDTALAVSTWGVNNLGLSWDCLALATGQDFPDALAGGVMQGRWGSVMLLTERTNLPHPVATSLTANADDIWEICYLGGHSAVSVTVRDEVEAILYKDPGTSHPPESGPLRLP